MGSLERASRVRVFTDAPLKLGADDATRGALTEAVQVPGEAWRGFGRAEWLDFARELVARPWRHRCLNLGGWWFAHLMMWDVDTGFGRTPGPDDLRHLWATGRLPGIDAEAKRLRELATAVHDCYVEPDLIWLDVETSAGPWDAPWFWDVVRSSDAAIRRFPDKLARLLRASAMPAWNSEPWRALTAAASSIAARLVAAEIRRGLELSGLVAGGRSRSGPAFVNYGYARTGFPVFDNNGWAASGWPLDGRNGAPVCYIDARDDAGRAFIRRYPRGDEAAMVDAWPEWCALVDSVNAVRSVAAGGGGACVPVLAAEWCIRDPWRLAATRELIGHAVRSGCHTFYLWNPGPDRGGTTTAAVEAAIADAVTAHAPWFQVPRPATMTPIDLRADRITTADLVTERAAMFPESAAVAEPAAVA